MKNHEYTAIQQVKCESQLKEHAIKKKKTSKRK